MRQSTLEIAVGWASETGQRRNNEDYLGSFLGSPSQRLSRGAVAALADGVSGGKGGRVAAELTVRQFIDGYYAQPVTLGVERAAARAIDAVNHWLHAESRSNPALENAGSTFTALILCGRRGHVLHVGDSRAYQLTAGHLSRLTEDHTLNRPEMTHILYRAIGLEAAVRLDHTAVPLQPHDRFLLCSDGVHGVLNDRRLQSLLAEQTSPEATARALVEAALAAGSTDNASALVIDIVAVPAAGHSELEREHADLPILAPPRAGEVVDDFRLDSVLSEGRYSRLFRAIDQTNALPVVVKFPEAAVAAERMCRLAFLREAWVAGRLRCPWLGTVLTLAPGRQSRLYTVMPFYAGETLEQRLNREPAVTLAEAVTITMGLAKAISALHRAGIIHRDIKPDNVILESGGGLKLIDFGVVRLPRVPWQDDDEATTTAAPGTPSYMAPELFSGAAGDERADLYALGVTVYRMLCRDYPYGEIEPFTRPRFHRPQPLSSRRKDLPAWLDAVLGRAVAAEPKDRYGDVLEFALELENGLNRGHGLSPPVAAKLPLYARNPVRFWQIISLLLTLALIASLAGGGLGGHP